MYQFSINPQIKKNTFLKYHWKLRISYYIWYFFVIYNCGFMCEKKKKISEILCLTADEKDTILQNGAKQNNFNLCQRAEREPRTWIRADSFLCKKWSVFCFCSSLTTKKRNLLFLNPISFLNNFFVSIQY